jgi:hypothetical protein
MASITNFEVSDDLVFVNLYVGESVPFIRFFHALEILRKIDFDSHKGVIAMHEFEVILKNAHGHALNFRRNAPFRSQQDR